jgi:peptidoglycan/xylan/chitin deacetylase (PgdA/CDA1 family)
LKQAVIRSGLEALYFTGAYKLMQPYVGGLGAILTLHHVRPARRDRFQPNRLLEITPEFLAALVRRLKKSGFDFVSLDEAHRRLTEGESDRRFVAMTLDDGYRDNLEWAYPIFKRNDVPFTIFVPTSFPDRLGQLWWATLEQVIAKTDAVTLEMDGRGSRLVCRTVEEKYRAYDCLYWWLRARPRESEMLAIVSELAARYRVEAAAICDKQCMTWEEIGALAEDPLVTIGAHTVNHVMLAKLPIEAARSEIKMGRAVLEAALGRRPEHLSYPYGDPGSAGPREFALASELGFLTAVTTRPGVLFPEHRTHLTALPRISINGEYQRARYVDVLVSGAGPALWNGFRRVAAA